MKKSSYLKYLNLSFQFFLIVLFFGIVGYFIDNYLFNNVSIFTLFIGLLWFIPFSFIIIAVFYEEIKSISGEEARLID